jgi:hypothetical protein
MNRHFAGRTALLILFVLAGCAPSTPRTGTPPAPVTVADVLERVRRAQGSAAAGVVLTEAPAGAPADTSVRAFGAGGRVRSGTTLGFDGEFAFQIDRTGMATPVPQRLREKLGIPLWVRGGWWAEPDAPFERRLAPELGDDSTVAVSFRVRDGLVPAAAFVDRRTWRVRRLVVEYERGPYTVDYGDWRPVAGRHYAFRTRTAYRDTAEHRVVRAAPLAPGDSVRFIVPPLPGDHEFDASVAAAVQTRRGVPFGPNSPGHYYVQPEIDGEQAGWFHFDSGSDGMQIDVALADRLGMPIIGRTRSMGADGRVREGTLRRGKTFRLGRLTFRDPVYLALDLSENNAPPGEKRAGVIGYPVFARAVVEFARDGEHIALFDPRGYALSPGAQWQPMSYIDLTPAVYTRIEGDRTGLYQLDTGHSGSLTLYGPYIRQESLLQGRDTSVVTTSGAGGSYREHVGTVQWIELGGRRFENVRSGFRLEGLSREGGAGNIGRRLMAPFTVVFDYPHRRVAFVPLPAG